MFGFKQYIKTANPNRFLLFWQLFFAVLAHAALSSIIIPYAKIVSNVSVANYQSAKGLVLIGILFCLLYCVSLLCSQIISNHLQINISKNIETKLLNKVLFLSEKTANSLNKQKLIETLLTDNEIISSFSQKIANFCGLFTELIYIFIILAISNISLFLIVLITTIIISLVNVFLSIIEKNYNNKSEELSFNKKNLLSQTIEGSEFSYSVNLNDSLFSENQDQNQKYSQTLSKKQTSKLVKDIFIYFIWTLFLSIIIIYMVNLVKTDYLTLSLFILIIPYLKDVINKSLSCFNISSDISNITSSCRRVNYILSLSTENISYFGQNDIDLLIGNLVFLNVSFNGETANLSNFTCSFAKNSLNNCIFINSESLKTFINLLNRKIKPDYGTITLDNVNIYDFSKDVYSHNVSIVYNSHFFFDQSIIENLKIVNNSKRNIIKTLKFFNIYDEIISLSNGLNSKTTEIKSNYTIFLLDLARSILTNAEIIVIESLPQLDSPILLQNLNKILIKISKSKNVIICSLYDLKFLQTKAIKVK